ncbi:DUF2073 domain-containing protein [Gracilibacillus caseinilyticus]|uniref:DUF2073 domain-containing protein n=1 Tax=Gracilibacillus caseinilyticus TaxID=2932256 RepID=A0ABY4EVC0_9BACI|nr:polysaccharide deacetylase family protein [Gracilibacillus caseinilyticus]UOQ47930.1 DUF2073 domain-containing protein [Gracilibacillus caseinilyticus]
MKKKLLWSGLAICCLILLGLGSYKLMNAREFQLFGELTAQVETDEKVIALTFDDGPSENVPGILSMLEDYQVKATFFLIGHDIRKYPELTKAIAAAGHQIGNHTYTHSRMIGKSPSFVQQELSSTDSLIRDAGYEGDIDFRPPFGKKLVVLPWILNNQKRETIMWNLEPDTYAATVEEKVDYVLDNIEKGSIILLHPMYDDGEELKVMETILKELTEQNYRFVTVDELQQHAN